MKNKYISIFLVFSFLLFSSRAEAVSAESQRVKAEGAAASSYHAVGISMVFWGVILVAGMAVAAILINSSSAHSE